MTRVGLNTNGFTPPADINSGAAGTVTGTERKKLQDVLDAAKRLATESLDGLLSAAERYILERRKFPVFVDSNGGPQPLGAVPGAAWVPTHAGVWEFHFYAAIENQNDSGITFDSGMQINGINFGRRSVVRNFNGDIGNMMGVAHAYCTPADTLRMSVLKAGGGGTSVVLGDHTRFVAKYVRLA